MVYFWNPISYIVIEETEYILYKKFPKESYEYTFNMFFEVTFKYALPICRISLKMKQWS